MSLPMTKMCRRLKGRKATPPRKLDTMLGHELAAHRKDRALLRVRRTWAYVCISYTCGGHTRTLLVYAWR
jgi:hypothetical protein